MASSIWLHAVSVGEVLSAVPLVQALRKQYPKAPIFVSCTTVAGRELAENKLASLVDGLLYAPVDYVRPVRRILRKLRPALVVILETEIWPNFWREVKRSGAALAVVNGRMSDRAFPRYRALSGFFAAPLAQPDLILVQSEQDRQRYLAAGAPPDRVRIGGNLKYDFTPSSGEIAAEVGAFLERVQPCQVWIAASTMPPAEPGDPDEDDVVVAAFQQLAPRHPNLLLVHVPRRPERFDTAAAKLAAAGVRFVRRSQLGASDRLELPGVLLLDTIGELSRLFALADVVFMGGTLPHRGGHNILEPAFFGKAVITGPHMENFAAIDAEFSAANATVRIASGEELAPAVARLLDQPAERDAVGGRARGIATAKRGVTARIVAELLDLYDQGWPRGNHGAWLQPLAALWRKGVERDRARKIAVKLSKPVISVGNITTGGSGKTPMVECLATQLRERGLQPAILTRGYRRKTSDSALVLPAGSTCCMDRTGDEAQIFLRSGHAHVGIGADRVTNAQTMEKMFPVDVFLLDDGMQHWRIQRDVDLVLVDALDPFGGGELLPRGRLREPLEGLSRASAFVLSRTEPGLRTTYIESVIRRYNPAAPIFRAGVRAVEWHDARTGQVYPVDHPPFRRVGAFCGLGNPVTFKRTLKALEMERVFYWKFGDHHSYRPAQMFRLVEAARNAGAEALVTTEKDFLNFPQDMARVPRDLPIAWLKIAIDIEDLDGLMEFVLGRIR